MWIITSKKIQRPSNEFKKDKKSVRDVALQAPQCTKAIHTIRSAFYFYIQDLLELHSNLSGNELKAKIKDKVGINEIPKRTAS